MGAPPFLLFFRCHRVDDATCIDAMTLLVAGFLL